MKKLLFVLLLALNLWAAENDTVIPSNWGGHNDTGSITDVLDSASFYYTRVFDLSAWQDLRVTVFVDDTSETGFASDSVNFIWGYRTGHPCVDTGSVRRYNIDTTWDDHMTVDTFSVANYGAGNIGVQDSTMTLTRNYGGVDTTEVAGFAYQSRQVVPEWDVFIKFWARSLGGAQKDGAALNLRFEQVRKNYIGVRRR